jgi:hypothetical protein
MPDNFKLPPIWNPEPVKLVVVEQPEPDEDDEREEFLAAIEAAKDEGTELITTEHNHRR